MSMSLAGLHPQLRTHAEKTVQLGRAYGVHPTITSVFRTIDFQRQLYTNFQKCKAAGLQGRNVQLTPGMSCAWPANPPGASAHNYGLAWDSTVPAHQQALWNAIRRAYGWHVLPNDEIHAEYPGWREIVAQ